ncbi:hypothetical protein [Sinorhizobium sp. Sb3]|uniref:hypothetical protein n=1 Tax=Ensifer sp. 22460 TaxID=3453922 RepID=UPI0012E35B10
MLFDGMIGGLFTGKKLGDYFNQVANDPVGARAIINSTDKAKLFAGYYRNFLDALEVSNAGRAVGRDAGSGEGRRRAGREKRNGGDHRRRLVRRRRPFGSSRRQQSLCRRRRRAADRHRRHRGFMFFTGRWSVNRAPAH